jgi:hypothetical protein
MAALFFKPMSVRDAITCAHCVVAGFAVVASEVARSVAPPRVH